MVFYIKILSKVSREYDTYLTDRFGYRKNLVALNKYIQYNLLDGKIFNEKALKGRDGWYFYISKGDGDNLSDFFKTNLMTQEQLQEFKTRLVDIVDWCREHGMHVLFVVAPNKHTVYPEKYPFARPDGITRADQEKRQNLSYIGRQMVERYFPYIAGRN